MPAVTCPLCGQRKARRDCPAVGQRICAVCCGTKRLIYDHRPASLSAGRLVQALKPRLAEAGQGGGTAFERDAAVVFKQIGEAAAHVRELEPDNRNAFVEISRRTIRKPAQESSER